MSHIFEQMTPTTKVEKLLAQIDHLNGIIADANSKIDRLTAVIEEIERSDNMAHLDLSKDPDPYGLYGLSLKHRMQVMGWPL